MRGTERVRQKFPLRFQVLLIVTRTGRDYRRGPRQRIEQVARQGSPLCAISKNGYHCHNEIQDNYSMDSELFRRIGSLSEWP